MAYATITIPGDGATTLIPVNFALGVIPNEEVTVRVSGEDTDRVWSWVGTGMMQVDGAPCPNGQFYTVRRRTPKTEKMVDWLDGEPITEESLNVSQLQALHLIHEALDAITDGGDDNDIVHEAPADDKLYGRKNGMWAEAATDPAFADTYLNKAGTAENASKLGGQTSAEIRDRANHTGTQAISTVDGLSDALSGKAPSTHTHSISQVTGLPAALDSKAPVNNAVLTGIPRVPTADAADSSNQAASTAHVKAAISAAGGGGGPGGGDASTLGGQSGDYYRARTNHTGTQAISTVTGLEGELGLIKGLFQTKDALSAAVVAAGLNSILLLGYTSAGDCPPAMLVRAAGITSGNAQSFHFADGNGGYWIISGASFDPKQLGVKGDYVTNDSVAFQSCLDFFELTKIPIVAGPMNIGIHVSLDFPAGFRMHGCGPADINTWIPTEDKLNMSPGKKHLVKGTNLFLKGAATKTYTTNRSNNYQSFTYGVSYKHLERMYLEGFGIIQDMDVYNSSGVDTSKTGDNRSNYNVGMVARMYSGRMNNVNIFGYWQSGTSGTQLSGKNGFVLHSQKNLENVDSDYFTAVQCMFTGVAIIAGSWQGTGDQGLTGSLWVGCHFYNGADHHNTTLSNSDYSKPAIYIDGWLEDVVRPNPLPNVKRWGIRGHTFQGCHLRTRNNEIIHLGCCTDIKLDFYVVETPIATGVPGGNIQGIIVGEAGRTGAVYATPCSGSPDAWRLDLLASQCQSLISLGGPLGDETVFTKRVERDGEPTVVGGVRTFVNSVGDPAIQLFGDPTTANDGWVIQRDESDGEALKFRFDNSIKFTLDSAGNLTTSGTVNGSSGTPNLAPTFNNVSLNSGGYLAALSGALDLRGAAGQGILFKSGATQIASFATSGILTVTNSIVSTGDLDIRAAAGSIVRGRVGSGTVFSASATEFIVASPRITMVNGVQIITGSGTPGGTGVSAPVGSIYLRAVGGAGTCFYVKESGTDATGWVAK